MSLILDALRKSEAERRRGQAPSLYAATPVPGTRARPPWLRWLPLAVLAVLALVALITWTGSPDPVTKQELEAESADSLLDGADDDNAASANAALATAPAAPPPAAPVVRAPAAPAPTVDALVKPTPAPPVATAPAATPTIVAAAPPPPEAAPAAQAAAEALPPVAVLDPGTRSNLPAMKLSMHVYNDDSARRFAIIDGQRVTEGAQLGSATVVEIRRDGVVLEVGGRRVLLPRP